MAMIDAMRYDGGRWCSMLIAEHQMWHQPKQSYQSLNSQNKKKNEKPNIRMRIEIVVKNEANGIKIYTNSMQFSVRIV